MIYDSDFFLRAANVAEIVVTLAFAFYFFLYGCIVIRIWRGIRSSLHDPFIRLINNINPTIHIQGMKFNSSSYNSALCILKKVALCLLIVFSLTRFGSAQVNYDAGITSADPTNRLAMWPLFQNGPFGFEGRVRNFGTQFLNSALVTVQVFNSSGSMLFNTSVAVQNIDTDQYFNIGTFTSPAKGIYTFKAYSTIPLIADQNPYNDTLYGHFMVTDSTYARDYGNFDTAYTTQSYYWLPVGPTIMGQVFELSHPAEITSIQFRLVGPDSAGDSLYAVVYNVIDSTGFPGTEIAQTAIYYLTPADTVDSDTIDFSFPILNGPLALPAGKFYIGIREKTQVNIITTTRVFTLMTTFNKSYSTGFAWIRNEQYNNGIIFGFQTYFLRPSFGCVTSGETAAATATSAPCGASTAQVTVSGNHPGLSYLWTNGATTATAYGLNSGTYTVIVTDQGGCTLTASTTVAASTPGIIIDSASVSNIPCSGLSTGSIQIFVGNGAPPFTYQWSDGSTNAFLTNLAAGSYTVSITDQNNCTISQVYFVTEPDPLGNFFTITPDSGTGTGSATIIVFGGTSPYTYQWSDGQVGLTATGLFSGTYTVTVTDVNGCSFSAQVFVGTVGISQINSGIYSLGITPNPSGGIIHLTGDLQQPSYLTIALYSVQGSRVFYSHFKEVKALNKTLNFENLGKGVYVMELITQSGIIHRRLVIE